MSAMFLFMVIGGRTCNSPNMQKLLMALLASKCLFVTNLNGKENPSFALYISPSVLT